MVHPNQFKDASKKASMVLRRGAETVEQTLLHDIPDGVVSTARIIISAEERLRQRLRSILRVTVATLFLGISGLISLGANVTIAFAKKVSPESTRIKRTRHNSLKTRYHLRNGDKNLRHESIASWGHHKTKHTLHGVASWYGGKFQNRRTASGVRFNTHAMMAAHRTLPFGTKVRVTNLKNHKSCVVEITDRGPYAFNRVIDLSQAAAEKIGMTAAGTAEVRIEPISSPVDLRDIAANSESLDDFAPKPVFDGIPSFPLHTIDSVLSAVDLAEQLSGE